MKKLFVGIILLIFINNVLFVKACTTAIISGKYTKDGRPLLLKVRDTYELQNKLMFFSDGKYEYIGLVNSKDTVGKCIWAGCNSMGFAIMNSATFNLNMTDTFSIQNGTGLLMKRALQYCATIEDFEEMVKASNQPIGMQANFGVIDAKGGAAYYEIGNNKFTKFDANDSLTAPFGYLIRTNFSYTGDRDEDRGLIRFQTADELFKTAYSTNTFSSQFLIRKIGRCLKQSLTKTDLSKNIPISSEEPFFVDYQDFIPNYYTSAVFVVQGVRKNESPLLTTIWTVLGFPLCSVAIPTWIKGGKDLPAMLQADSSGTAPFCMMSLKLKEKIFSLVKGNSGRYINLSSLLNRNNDGILQKILLLEDEIIKGTKTKLENWRENGISSKDIQDFYRYVDKEVKLFYKENFNL